MPHELTIILPWPPKECSPNARVHWAKKSRTAKRYRSDCKLIAHLAVVKTGNPVLGMMDRGSVDMDIAFYPPDRRHRDDDNLIGAFKAGRDGIADALRCDDKAFRIHPYLSGKVCDGGEVVVTIRKREREAA